MLSSIWKLPLLESEYEQLDRINSAKAEVFDLIFKCKKTNKFSIVDVDISKLSDSIEGYLDTGNGKQNADYDEDLFIDRSIPFLTTTDDLYYTIN
jgi:hypothetical protein